jgi:alkylhydroperoxidase/carboxymuconolactone decarboxylase family protein YurZ
MHDPLHAAFELAASVDRGQAEATRQAALRVETHLGSGASREILRVLHLFFGFPKIVQALNACIEVMPALSVEPSSQQEANPLSDRAQGELNFRQLYAEDADRVLKHLAWLDPIFCEWILDHAYARGLQREGLDVTQIERLAVLCLAATDCWKQWESHVAIARRLGVTRATLQADCEAAQAWLGAASCAKTSARLAEMNA